MNKRSALVLVALLALAGCKSCSKARTVSVPATGTIASSIGTFGPASGSSAASAGSPMPPLVVGGGIGEPIALPASVTIDGTPEYSPDGKKLVATSRDGDGRHQIFVADRDGGNARRISDGKADDIDPTFGPDGRTVFFASDAAGNYDIWQMRVDGSGRTNLTRSPEDERWPRVSPIEFRLVPISPGGVEGGSKDVGPLKYRRVLFQRGSGKTASVWGMLDDGRFPVRVSPEGVAARHPAWSQDGLQIAFDADFDGASFLVVGRGRVVERNCQGGGCPTFIRFWDEKTQREIPVSLEKALEAPKDWFAYDLRVLGATRGHAYPVFFPNQTALLAVREDGGAELRAVDLDGPGTVPLAPARPGSTAAFSPTGEEIAFAGTESPNGTLRVATSRFYLSEARNLYRYPELVKSKPAKLAQNRFVVVPGTEREFFHVLEKVRYARKGVFVSADAVVQLMHDLIEARMQRAERKLAPELATLDRELLRSALALRPKASDADELAVHLAVAAVLLGEAQPAKPTDESAASAVSVPVEEVLASLKLPAVIERRVREEVARVHLASSVVGLVDYTKFAPRGHYADGGVLAAYFRAVTWLGTVPLGTPDRPEPWLLAWNLLREEGLMSEWERLDGIQTLLAGPPEDPSFRELSAAARTSASGQNTATDEGERVLLASVLASAPANRVGGMAIAKSMTNAEARELSRKKQLLFFPQRAQPDAAWLTVLMTPFVKDRQYPDPLDVMSALGSARARVLLERGELSSPAAQPYAAALRAALETVAEDGKRLLASKADDADLPTAWLRTIALLASPPTPEEAPGGLPAFAAADAWNDRALVSAVAAYTLYKHSSVLYAKQPSGAEAGEGGDDLSFWKELPVEKPIRGYVEPHPRLYASMGKLARMLDHVAPPLSAYGWDAVKLFDRLREVSEKELAGRPLTEDEYAWIDHAGAAIEYFYVRDGNSEIERSPERIERGVKLVTDVVTNLNPGERKVLELATGDVNTLYVITTHGDEQLVTQGGAHGIYLFTQPMEQRLTDQQWGDLVNAGKQPPPPAWTVSFVETPK